MAKETFKYTVEEGSDQPFDSKGTMVLAMRKVGWGDSDPRLELRKWFITEDKETASKGFAFLTEEGPHNLTRVLTKSGYGKTRDILESIKDRSDFKSSLDNMLNGIPEPEEEIIDIECEEEDTADYYDPRECLFG